MEFLRELLHRLVREISERFSVISFLGIALLVIVLQIILFRSLVSYGYGGLICSMSSELIRNTCKPRVRVIDPPPYGIFEIFDRDVNSNGEIDIMGFVDGNSSYRHIYVFRRVIDKNREKYILDHKTEALLGGVWYAKAYVGYLKNGEGVHIIVVVDENCDSYNFNDPEMAKEPSKGCNSNAIKVIRRAQK